VTPANEHFAQPTVEALFPRCIVDPRLALRVFTVKSAV
jgi:hypothetical protein